jgi:hypothetical protein
MQHLVRRRFEQQFDRHPARGHAPGRAAATEPHAAHGVPGRSQEPVQAKLAASELGTAPPAQAGGAPLPAGVRGTMERAFGVGFGGVRVVAGDPAVARMGAQAFARNEQLHFAPGAYAPGTPAGDELIGHELAHVVQQRDGRVARGQAKGGVVADAALEREADDHGARAARGEPVGHAASSTAGASPAHGGTAQLKLTGREAHTAMTSETRVWAQVEGRHYFKQAQITGFDEEAGTVTVTFPQGKEQGTVTLDDLYALDSDDLEPYTTADTARDTAHRLVRKLGSGRVTSDTFNTLGVITGGASLVGQVYEKDSLFTVGIVGGFGVALGGAGQIIRAIACCGKSTSDRLLEAATGGLNVLAGTLGIVSGFTGIEGKDELSTWLGIGSVMSWEAVELLNIVTNGRQALTDLGKCNVTFTLASVICSIVKMLGSMGLVIGGAIASEPVLIAAMVVAGAGTLGSVITGMIKLARMAIHHFTHNRPLPLPHDGGDHGGDNHDGGNHDGGNHGNDHGGDVIIELGNTDHGSGSQHTDNK